MDYLTRPYSNYEVPRNVDPYQPQPMQQQAGWEMSRAPTAFSTTSSNSRGAPMHWRDNSNNSSNPYASSQSPAPQSILGLGGQYRDRYSSQSSHSGGSGGALPSSINSHSGGYLSSTSPPTTARSEPSPQQQHNWLTPTTSRRFSQVDFGWQTVFDSNYHRIPVYAENWFKKDWEVRPIRYSLRWNSLLTDAIRFVACGSSYRAHPLQTERDRETLRQYLYGQG